MELKNKVLSWAEYRELLELACGLVRDADDGKVGFDKLKIELQRVKESFSPSAPVLKSPH